QRPGQIRLADDGVSWNPRWRVGSLGDEVLSQALRAIVLRSGNLGKSRHLLQTDRICSRADPNPLIGIAGLERQHRFDWHERPDLNGAGRSIGLEQQIEHAVERLAARDRYQMRVGPGTGRHEAAGPDDVVAARARV